MHCALETAVRKLNLNYLCLGGRAEGSGDLGSWAVSFSIFFKFLEGVVGCWLVVGRPDTCYANAIQR